jgi:hypothetical protein
MKADAATLSPSTALVQIAECPLNHGVAVVDQLLAAITREEDAVALDVALDFRLLLAGANDADTVLREFFRLRAVVEEQHYLACFRLRRWLQSAIFAEVRLDRSQPIRRTQIDLNAQSYRELCARCAFEAAAGELLSPWVRVVFTSNADRAPALV